VVGLVIFGQVFGPQQVARVFGFLSFYFVGLGWFVVCVGVVLFFFKAAYAVMGKVLYFCKKLGFSSLANYFMFFFWGT